MPETVLIPVCRRNGRLAALALIDPEDIDLTRSRAWRLSTAGYAKSHTGGHDAPTIFLHREILGLASSDPREGDHRNGNRLDNRRSNLRIITPEGNRQNRSAWASSGLRGVSWSASRGKWQATVNVDHKRYWLGRYDSPEEAAAVVRAFRREHMPFYVEREA